MKNIQIAVSVVLALFAVSASAGDINWFSENVGQNKQVTTETVTTVVPILAPPSLLGVPPVLLPYLQAAHTHVTTTTQKTQHVANYELSAGSAWWIGQYSGNAAGFQASLYSMNGRLIVAPQSIVILHPFIYSVFAPQVSFRSGYSNAGFVGGIDLIYQLTTNSESSTAIKLSFTEFQRGTEGGKNIVSGGLVRYFK